MSAVSAPVAEGERELEWQFDALDLGVVVRRLEDVAVSAAEAPLEITPGRGLRQVDIYLDTDDRRFQRAGYTLRIRRLPRNGAEATLKALGGKGTGRAGMRSRRELTERLEIGDSAGVVAAPGPVGQRVRALAGKRRLRPLFEVHTNRKIFVLDVGETAAGEIAIDETAIRAGGGRALARLRRVEVEVPERAVERVEPFVERLRSACGLQPATLSKFEAGLVATGPQPVQGPPSFGTVEIEPGNTIGEVALAVLRRQFGAMLEHEPGTRLGDDVEELHDMRVATRRLRAALALFSDFLPVEAGRLRDEPAWVGQTIGTVRDLDVQLAQLDEWVGSLPRPDREPLLRLREMLSAEREKARAEMLEALDSRRYQTFISRFGRMLRSGRGARTPPARAVAPGLLEKRRRALRKAVKSIGPDSPASNYHRARIAGKRFRYALEFLADVYPGRSQSLTRRTVALQDILGGIQDADVAVARLRALAADPASRLPPETVFAMGEIAERYGRSMGELRERVPVAYARLKGKAWRSFLKSIRAEIPATAPLREPVPPQPAESGEISSAAGAAS